MASFHRCIFVLSFACLIANPALPQARNEPGLQKQIEELKTQLKSVQNDVDQIKATLREQSARANPVFDITGDPSKGEPGAKLVVVEFSDFECPFCLEYFKTIYSQVIEGYVKTGKVRYVFADFPGESIHPHALKAAEAGRCGNEQGKFWEMHDQLFMHQRDLATTGIQDAAHAAGLNQAQFESCLNSGKYTPKIRAAEEATAKMGVNGTPAFLIGTPDPADPSKIKLVRALVGAQPFAAFQQAIDSSLPK